MYNPSRDDSESPFGKDSPELEALKLRTDYAWKWFSYHAGQRMSMFNYSLLVIGILANAYVAAVKDGLGEPAFLIAFLGLVMCITFVLLDYRNKRLVTIGENMLQYLEKRYLFTLDVNTDDSSVKEGILNCSKVEDIKDEQKRKRDFCRDALCGLWGWVKTLPRRAALGRHGALLPIVEFMFCAAFIAGLLYAPTLAQRAKMNTDKVEEKLTLMDMTFRTDVMLLKAQTEKLQVQLKEFENVTQNDLKQIKAKLTRPPKAKGGR